MLEKLASKVQRWLEGNHHEQISLSDTDGDSFQEGVLKLQKRFQAAAREFWRDDSVLKTHQAYKEMLSVPHFKELLPYAGYFSDDHIFVLDEGSLDKNGSIILNPGFVLEVRPQVGADESMENVLKSIFTQAPPGTGISIQLYATPDILPRLKQKARNVISDVEFGIDKEPWELRNRNIFATAMRNRIEHYINGAYKSIAGETSNYLLRDYRVIISVVMPYNVEDDGAIEDTIDFRKSMLSTLSASHLPGGYWTATALIDWVSDVLDHKRVLAKNNKPVSKEYDRTLPLREQFAQSGSLVGFQNDSIEFEDTETEFVSMSVRDFPKRWSLGAMSNLIGDYYQSSMSINCPFLITLLVVTRRHDEFKSIANMKAARLEQLKRSQMAMFNPSIHEESLEWQYAQKSLGDGAVMVDLGMKVSLITSASNSKKAIADTRAVFANKGFTLSNDRFLQALSFKSIIPMGLTQPVISDLRDMGHLGLKFSNNAVSLSPLIAEWKGTNNNTITLFGRRGQIMGFDFFDSDTNYNFAIAATSGSGKSFLMNEIALSYLSIGGKVWIIDVGRSYEKLCRVMGGEFIVFSDDSNICMNPFTFIGRKKAGADAENEDDGDVKNIDTEMEMLKPLFEQMMTRGKSKLSGTDLSHLEMAIKNTYLKYGNASTVTKVRDELLTMCRDEGYCTIRDMATMLYPWTVEGMYGKFFEGEANLSFNNNFTVLELEELKSRPDLQAVVLMLLMYQISDDMYLGERKQRKIVFLDEAWDLFSSGVRRDAETEESATAKFIKTGYRRARKYGGSFGTATQSVSDYYQSSAAEAALNNSEWLLLLNQKKESITMLGKEGKLSLDPYQERMLRDVHSRRGVYSEVFVSYTNGSGVGRLFVDGFSKVLFSSKAEDFEDVKKYEAQGYDLPTAVQKVAEDRGWM